jgi:hypothetical protein
MNEHAFRAGFQAGLFAPCDRSPMEVNEDIAWNDYEPPEPVFQLFLVTAESHDGDSLDLFVWAADVAEVVLHWEDYYAGDQDCDAPRCFEVPRTGLRGAVSWDVIVEHST